MPVVLINGRVLLESAAICTYLCDIGDGGGLLGRPGSYARGLHEQWTSFILTELEAYLLSNAKHSVMYPTELRVAEVIPRNNDEIRLAMTVLDKHLALSPHFLGDNFSVTDIVASWAISWACRGRHW